MKEILDSFTEKTLRSHWEKFWVERKQKENTGD